MFGQQRSLATNTKLSELDEQIDGLLANETDLIDGIDWKPEFELWALSSLGANWFIFCVTECPMFWLFYNQGRFTWNISPRKNLNDSGHCLGHMTRCVAKFLIACSTCIIHQKPLKYIKLSLKFKNFTISVIFLSIKDVDFQDWLCYDFNST